MTDAAGQPLDGVQANVLAVQRRGVAQSRVRAIGLGAGLYRASLAGLPAAEFELMVQAPAAELGYERGRLGLLRWPLPEAPAAGGADEAITGGRP